MKSYLTGFVFFIGALFIQVNSLYAQISGNTLTEYQLGNIPDAEPADRGTLYNQINLLYQQDNFKARVRFENFLTNDSIKRDYLQLSQYSLSYNYKKIDITVGNIYETLGRGLLLRSYEISGSIYEDRIYRTRQGFYKDIQGASVSFRNDIFSMKALAGKPLNNFLPITSNEKRTDFVEALETTAKYGKQKMGARFLRVTGNTSQNSYGSASLEGIMPLKISYYGEFVQEISGDIKLFRTSADDSYGAYLSFSKSFKSLGISFELKDYHNLIIGKGISDPPTLVKEHAYKLLNRSTHVSDLGDERGYQLEMYYNFKNDWILTFNTSKAISEYIKTYVFNEYFLELYVPIQENNSLKTFIDLSQNDISNETGRIATGLYFSTVLTPKYSSNIDIEFQHIERQYPGFDPDRFINFFSSIEISNSGKYSAALNYEFSNDPQIADKPSTARIEKSKHYPGLLLSYRPSNRINLGLFAGSRRGGPACNSGICYKVLDFEGIELRLSTKFN